jgi:hypothetical protein
VVKHNECCSKLLPSPSWMRVGVKLASKSKVVCDGAPFGLVGERGSGNGDSTDDLAASAGSMPVMIRMGYYFLWWQEFWRGWGGKSWNQEFIFRNIRSAMLSQCLQEISTYIHAHSGQLPGSASFGSCGLPVMEVGIEKGKNK